MAPRKSGGRGRPSAPPIPVPAAYPARKDDASGLDEAQWRACRDMLEAVYKAKEGSRLMCAIFRELPDKEEWADYYDAIPEPEALDLIAGRLGAQGFNTPEAFFKQLHLVFLNAMHYNEEGSQVWNDAKTFETMIHEAWRAHAEQGTFASPDPRKPPPKGRKAKDTKSPVTPAPAAPKTPAAASPPVTIHLRVNRQEPATPAPAPAPRETPRPRERHPRAAQSPTKVMPSRAAKEDAVHAHAAHETAHAAQTQPQAQPQAQAPPPQPVARTPASNSALPPSEKAIVDATDAKLPKWDGPQTTLRGDPAPGGVLGSGWWGEGSPDYERRVGGQASWKGRIHLTATAIEIYKDPQGVRLAEALHQIPSDAEIPYLDVKGVSWAGILQRVRGGGYNTLLDFDKDMSRLFEKARRWFQASPREYGHVLTLQRLYNAVTAPYPLQIAPNGMIPPSATKFASLPAGPGVARSLYESNEALRGGASQEEAGFGVTTSRIPTKDRHFTEEARHKGVAYRVGDYVHLINPDDASRPIVAQVFKTFVPTKGYSTHHVTVCWYLRPEQTTHPAEQTFVENEVFKTAHFCDHPVEDIIERIAVQPTESASLGRPRPPAFFPGWPLYVCSMRYIDKACLFLRIKKWANVLPEQLRGVDVTAVIPFERPVQLPSLRSPFTRGVQGPGAIGRPKRQPLPADAEEDEAAAAVVHPQAVRRPSGPPADPRSRTATTTPMQQTPQQRHPYPAQAPQPGPSRQPQQAGYPGGPPQAAANYRQPQQQAPLYAVRTFAAVMGGAQVLEQVAVREYLPPETARLFEQDARHQVLWFSGPPIAPGALRIPERPRHSLEYLAYLSKRKAGASEADARPGKRFRRAVEDDDAESEEDAEGEDDDDDEPADELSGDVGRHWWAKGQTAEQVMAGLRAVAGF